MAETSEGQSNNRTGARCCAQNARKDNRETISGSAPAQVHHSDAHTLLPSGWAIGAVPTNHQQRMNPSNPAPFETFIVSPDGKSITCKRCKKTSYNLNDVE